MMRVLRAMRGVALDFIDDEMLEDENFLDESFKDTMKNLIETQRDNTFVLQAFDGDKLKAFLIAYAPENQSNVILFRVWCTPEITDRKLQDSLFLKLCLWAEAIGRTSITAETDRSPKALHRRWGFKEVSTVVKFELDEGFTESLIEACLNLDTKKKESDKEKDNPLNGLSTEGHDNGKVERRKHANSVESNERPEEGGKANLPTSSAKSGT